MSPLGGLPGSEVMRNGTRIKVIAVRVGSDTAAGIQHPRIAHPTIFSILRNTAKPQTLESQERKFRFHSCLNLAPDLCSVVLHNRSLHTRSDKRTLSLESVKISSISLVSTFLKDSLVNRT